MCWRAEALATRGTKGALPCGGFPSCSAASLGAVQDGRTHGGDVPLGDCVSDAALAVVICSLHELSRAKSQARSLLVPECQEFLAGVREKLSHAVTAGVAF